MRRFQVDTSYSLAYKASLLSGAGRSYDCVITQRRVGTQTETRIVVVGGSAFSGTQVSLRESAVRLAEYPEVRLRLPTMAEPLKIPFQNQFGCLPFVGIGYLDLATERHPMLNTEQRATSSGEFVVGTCQEIALVCEEELDPFARVLHRRVELGPYQRNVEYEYEDWSRDHSRVPTVMRGSDTFGAGFKCVREGPLVTVEPEWHEQDAWLDERVRSARLESL